MQFEWYHFLLTVFIYLVLRNYMKSKSKPIEDRITKSLPNVKNLYLHMALLIVLPVIIFSSKLNLFPFEKWLVMLTYILTFRCGQYYINNNQQLDILYSIVTLISLFFINFGIVSREHLLTVYSYNVAIGLLALINRQTNTNQLLNDFVLVHFMFYILK